MPAGLAAFIDSGRVVDLVLAVLLLELISAWLGRAWLTRRFNGRLTPGRLFIGALPGAAILLALRAALTGGDAAHIAGWLGLSFLLHALDLLARGR